MEHAALETQFQRIADAIEQRASDRLVTETLETWQAVAREAGLWARKLGELSPRG